MEDNRISHDIYCQAIGQCYLDAYMRVNAIESRSAQIEKQYKQLVESLQSKLSQKQAELDEMRRAKQGD